MGVSKLGAALALAVVVGVQSDPPEERLYGRVTTTAGQVLEGFLRWDRNEASWWDFLDGTKVIPWEHLKEAEDLDPEYGDRRRRERSIEAFGVRITWDRDEKAAPVTVASAVRFGRLASLVVLDDRRALVTLTGGEELVLSAGSSDLGRTMRGLLVDDPERGVVDLAWRDVDRVDFRRAPPSVSPRERRLHGTLVTQGGVELTGYVAWDLDEAFTSDILDGEDSDGVDREIPFEEIGAIELESSRSARVVLLDGRELVLRGTNDVDRGNRGIEISDPSFGRATVPWGELDALRLHERRGPPGASADLAPVGAIRGTVWTRGGDELSGRIRWDNDEEYGWEVLDGWREGVEYDIEFGRVASIARLRTPGVRVTLRDGRAFDLARSNDVDGDNKGIFVTDDAGRTTVVRWSDFDRAVLTW